MNNIFSFTNKSEVYKKCIFASVAHAIMVGCYPLLSDEIAWDGKNYLFQNMEGISFVIAFSDNYCVCAVQNEEMVILGKDEICNKLFDLENNEIGELISNEILPYMLIESADEDVPAISTSFWGDCNVFYSMMEEKEIMKYSGNILLPYLYEFEDLVRYWRDYYECSDIQMKLIIQLFEKRIVSNDSLKLNNEEKKMIADWSASNLDICKQSLEEIGIIYE